MIFFSLSEQLTKTTITANEYYQKSILHLFSELEGWVSQIYGLGDEVYFDSVDFRCDIGAIYRKVPGVGKGYD